MTQRICKYCQETYEAVRDRGHCYKEVCRQKAKQDKERHRVPNGETHQPVLDLINFEYGGDFKCD